MHSNIMLNAHKNNDRPAGCHPIVRLHGMSELMPYAQDSSALAELKISCGEKPHKSHFSMTRHGDQSGAMNGTCIGDIADLH